MDANKPYIYNGEKWIEIKEQDETKWLRILDFKQWLEKIVIENEGHEWPHAQHILEKLKEALNPDANIGENLND